MEYLVRRMPHTELLAENSGMMPVEDLNGLVRKEIERVAPLVSIHEASMIFKRLRK